MRRQIDREVRRMTDSVTVGDIDIHYRVMGEGKPLVMIMGLTANMDTWEPALLERLAGSYRVLVFDNRGAGRNSAPPGTFSISQFADDTAGLMDALGMGRAFVLGESMGGMIAQEVALRHPEKVEKLVLCCTFCGGEQAIFPGPEVLEVLTDRGGTPEEIVRRGLEIVFPDEWVESNPEQVEDFVRRALLYPICEENALRQGEAIFGFSTHDRLPGIDCPVLVACGTDDVLIPPENSTILADRFPDARLVEFPGGGHGFAAQFHEEFASKLSEFLG